MGGCPSSTVVRQRHIARPVWRRIPCLGWSVAGPPTEVDPDLTTVEVPAAFGACDHLVALRVLGESMIAAHILPGDVLVVHRQAHAAAGDLVIVETDQGWTLKRWQPRGRLVCLRAENPEVPDRWLPMDRVRVWGVVIGVLRKYR